MKKLFSLLLVLLMALSLCSCSADFNIDDLADLGDMLSDLEAEMDEYASSDEDVPDSALDEDDLPKLTDEEVDDDTPADADLSESGKLDVDAYYYDLESVVLYIETYDMLPANYITKNEARDLGWTGGSVDKYQEGAAIGGDRFGNREGILPKQKGRTYTECDIDTNGASSRGAKRLVFSSDGLYFYTDDHYESFSEVYVTEDGTVEWK